MKRRAMHDQAGKGDKPRKVDQKRYGDNFDRIFRKDTTKVSVYQETDIETRAGMVDGVCVGR